MTKKIVRDVVAKTVVKNKSGPKTYVLKDKEAYIVATSEIDSAHELPRYIVSISNKLQQVLHDVGNQIIVNGMQSKSAIRYAPIVIQRVNRGRSRGTETKNKDRYDKSFRPNPQEGKSK